MNQKITKISEWITLSLCIIFSILYAIWAQPETILIRHICLILGGLLGIYVIYQFRKLLLTKLSLPIWLIFALFAWITFHLFYLSLDYPLQLIEYKSIWKRTAIGFIFAMGLGLALGSSNRKSNFWIIFIGMLMPALLYLVRYFFTYYGVPHQIDSPDWLKLYPGSAPFYIPKTSYVAFCLPPLAISLAMLHRNILSQNFASLGNIIYILAISLEMLIFYLEKILNGIVYASALILIFTFSIFLKLFLRLNKAKKLIILLILITLASATGYHLNSNLHISQKASNLIADSKVILKPDEHTQWLTSTIEHLPINENGFLTNEKYYARVSWAYNALGLIKNYPLGYGLIEQSFGKLAKIRWPQSDLTQSHSGWIDLTLGIGLPGTLLIILASYIAISQAKENQTMWGQFGFAYLLALLLLWITTEVSQRVFFDSLIFTISLVTGISLNNSAINSLNGKIITQK